MFSVIMPVYNGEKHLIESIKSVLDQTYKLFELIIIDDGSDDGSLEICRQFEKSDGRVKVFSQINSGVSSARNFGISVARYDYILFIDCDDVWDRDLLNLCNEKCHGQSLLFGIKRCFYNKDGSINDTEDEMFGNGSCYDLQLNLKVENFFSRYNLASPCNKVYLNKIIRENGIMFSELSVYLEDLKFNLDYLSCITEIRILQKSLYFYRLDKDCNQINKRNFKNPFINADELYYSFDNFSVKKTGKSCIYTDLFVSIILKTYIDELKYYIYTHNYKKNFNLLICNKNFKTILKKSRGKFNLVLKLAFRLRLKCLIRMLVRNRG